MLLPPIVSLFLAILLASSVLWALGEAGRRYSVRGSARRYVFASIERALRWPALAYFAVSATLELSWYRDYFLVFTSCAGMALWGVLYWDRKRNGDDDDFWSTLKSRLKASSLGRRTALGGA